MLMFKQQGLSLLVVASLLPGYIQAADEELLSRMSVKQRLERLENIVGSDVLMQQSRQLDALQQEVSMLRDMLEEKDYELDLITQRQRSLYSDMDRRLNNLEAGASRSVTTAPVPPPGAAAAGAGAAMAVTSTNDKDGAQAYTVAFDLLKEGQYSKSITAFQEFLKNHPESKYADNAQYWLGEANYVSRQYKTALDAFQTLIARYPDSTKIPGARLKIGYTYYELKNWSAARDTLMQVAKLYPDTTVATKANERLDRIKREGH
jgi:tol-pal system protein YbgF